MVYTLSVLIIAELLLALSIAAAARTGASNLGQDFLVGALVDEVWTAAGPGKALDEGSCIQIDAFEHSLAGHTSSMFLLTFPKPDTVPATYQITRDGIVSASYWTRNADDELSLWTSASGTITVRSIYNGRIMGTFSFLGTRSDGCTIHVKAGVFDVQINRD